MQLLELVFVAETPFVHFQVTLKSFMRSNEDIQEAMIIINTIVRYGYNLTYMQTQLKQCAKNLLLTTKQVQDHSHSQVIFVQQLKI